MEQDWRLMGVSGLGVIIHCLIKMDGLQKDAKAANQKFNWVEDYWVVDRFAILLSLAVSVLWHFVFPEVSANHEKLTGFVVVSYAAMGLMGSYIIQLVLGRAKKFIRNVVDRKTNELDNKTEELKNLKGED